MSRFCCLLFLLCLAVQACAQDAAPRQTVAEGVPADADSIFKGAIYNKENHVYIVMDFYRQDLVVPDQEVFGRVPGYLGDNNDYRKWLFTAAQIVGPNTARLDITNDYGSEDLVATLTYHPNDSTYTLEQGEGSSIKIAVNRKWVKIPRKLDFKKQ